MTALRVSVQKQPFPPRSLQKNSVQKGRHSHLSGVGLQASIRVTTA